MKEKDKIPTHKVKRAGKFISAGAKVGGNYIKHYSKKIVNKSLSDDDLHTENAEDLFSALGELKGSALKVAQMLSMNEMLPKAYIDQFAMAQYNAPPLSYPLIVKTLTTGLGKAPGQIFDEFGKQAVNAASMGQVHKARIGDMHFAVKIQYPGVAESIGSDLKMVKPFASRMFNISKEEVEYYLSEVEEKLLEETDYELELQQSQELTQACRSIPNVTFANYYPEFSSSRILTMDWIEGKPLRSFLAENPSQEIRNKLGQAVWDFYSFQIHKLRKMHADPHPGNFIVTSDNQLAIIDFGCVKEMPDNFYKPYFKLVELDIENEKEAFLQTLREMKLLLPDDSNETQEFMSQMLSEIIALVGQPFRSDNFNFGNDDFFEQIYAVGMKYGHDKKLRKIKAARGMKDAIYINRTHIGMFSILNEIKAVVKTKIPENWIHPGLT